MTPYWTSHDGRHVLYHGDCLAVMPSLPAVDAVVTDPPYGIGANRQTLGSGKKQFIRGGEWDACRPPLHVFEAIHRTAPMAIIWGGNYFADLLPVNNDWLIWHKKNDGLTFSECEVAWTNTGRQMRHLSHHWGGEEKKHPTQKPLLVMQWCLSFLPPGCLVLDAYAGSGTTLVACVRTGRRSIGIELEERYCEIAARRMEAELAQPMLIPPAAPEHDQPPLFAP